MTGNHQANKDTHIVMAKFRVYLP